MAGSEAAGVVADPAQGRRQSDHDHVGPAVIVTKAPPQPYRRLHATADRFVPRFTKPYVESVLRARRRVTEADVERSLATGVPTGSLVDVFAGIVVAKAAEPAELAELAKRVYAELLAESAGDGGGILIDMLAAIGFPADPRVATLVGSLNVTNQHVLTAARTLTADLIREVSAESKANVRRIITRAIEEGIPPRDAAKLLREMKPKLGLTERQGIAQGNFRRGLVEAGRKPADVDRLVQRFADRQLRERSMNIARTETMRASNRGQQLMWQEMVNQGVLGPGFTQEWLVTRDDRLCERCAPMGKRVEFGPQGGRIVLPGKRAQLGDLFRETERGRPGQTRKPVAGVAVESPPLHPRCRCVLVAVIPDV